MIVQDKILHHLIEALKKKLGDRLQKIILYGSMARGDNTRDSDYDCIIIVDAYDSAIADAVDDVAGELLLSYGAVFSIIPVSQKYYITHAFNPLYININREGRTIWPKSA